MDVRIALVFFFAIYAIANTQRTRCYQTPNLWHGDFKEVDYDRGIFKFIQIDYDAIERRLHIIELEEERIGRQLYEQWINFNNHTVYTRNLLSSESCRVDSFPDDQQWRPFGVPPYSKFIGTEWLGGVDGGLLVDKFEEERDGGRYSGTFAPFRSSDSVCIPVFESYVKTEGPFNGLINAHYEFFNITSSVRPEVFVPCTPTL